jgi:PIN domain nuclease of toxin-antitoxin system
MPLLLDSHVVHWWSADELHHLSRSAIRALDKADYLAMASISWYELAWLARSERIRVSRPARSWLDELASRIRTVHLSAAIAETAASLPASFPRDPADRLIYATAIETGWQLVTKDERMRSHPYPRRIAIW